MGRIGRPLSACLSPCLSFSALPTCVNNSRLERHEERVAKGRKVDSDEGHRQEELRQLDSGESPSEISAIVSPPPDWSTTAQMRSERTIVSLARAAGCSCSRRSAHGQRR